MEGETGWAIRRAPSDILARKVDFPQPGSPSRRIVTVGASASIVEGSGCRVDVIYSMIKIRK